MVVGAAVGASVGAFVGFLLGIEVGADVGAFDGDFVGTDVGCGVGKQAALGAAHSPWVTRVATPSTYSHTLRRGTFASQRDVPNAHVGWQLVCRAIVSCVQSPGSMFKESAKVLAFTHAISHFPIVVMRTSPDLSDIRQVRPGITGFGDPLVPH